MRKLILFDIDGTLLVGPRNTHKDAFRYAFNKIYKVDAIVNEGVHTGKTDKKIIFDILENKQIPRKVILFHLQETYKTMREYFKKNIDLTYKQKTGPDVEKLLSELKQRGHILGLVTGNLEEIAKLKLKKTGLIKFFELGAFGELSEVRSDLVKKAVRQAEEKYGTIKKEDVFVIGDSLRDIECGKEAGVKTIAVATGDKTTEELAEHKPDYLFDNFRNYKEVVSCIER